MFNKIAAALVALGAGLALLLGANSGASAAPKLGDCRLVAKADIPLCQSVQRQGAYVYFTEGGNQVDVPNGRTLVKHEVTHAGLTKREMHSALVGYAQDYAKHVTYGRSVAVDVGSLVKAHGRDSQVDVGIRDLDGKPRGAWEIRVELDLP